MKVCSKCKTEKDESQFSKNRSKRDGLNNYCNPCRSEKHKEYMESESYRLKRRQRNKDYRRTERGKMICKNYREKISAKNKEYKKNYYIKQKQEISEKHKNYYERNKDKIIDKINSWRKKNPERVRAIGVKYHNSQHGKIANREWIEKNIHKRRAIANKYSKKQSKNLTGKYIKAILKREGYSENDIARIPELIEIKKIEIIETRINKLKKQKQNGKPTIQNITSLI